MVTKIVTPGAKMTSLLLLLLSLELVAADKSRPSWYIINMGPILAVLVVIVLTSMLGFIIWTERREREELKKLLKEKKED
jgi:predicted tellurium resistance membrane protein TerC